MAGNKKFLTHERRELIALHVKDEGIARVRDLTGRFGVSGMTIRRDIDALAAANRVRRVHGGAARIETTPAASTSPASK